MDDKTLARLAKNGWDMTAYPDPEYPPSPYYRFLYKLTQYLKPQASVELGTCGGGAAMHMAFGHSAGLVVSIDVAEDYPDNIKKVLSLCPNFQFWRTDSIDASYQYRELMLPPVGVLFIDTIHTYERTLAEFAAWRPILAPDAVVCLDDLFREGMPQAWAELPGRKWRMDVLHVGSAPTDGGFGVLYDIPVEIR